MQTETIKSVKHNEATKQLVAFFYFNYTNVQVIQLYKHTSDVNI